MYNRSKKLFYKYRSTGSDPSQRSKSKVLVNMNNTFTICLYASIRMHIRFLQRGNDLIEDS